MKLNRRTIILFAVNLALLILFGILAGVGSAWAKTLQTQRAAERWRGESEMSYSQVSVFRPSTDAMRYETIHSLRTGIDAALLEASMEGTDEAPLWTDCFCAMSQIAVSSDKTKNAQTTLYAIGGDFFAFHPLRLSSGSYIAESDLNRDLVVIDRELSWTLFGSTDGTGLSLYYEGKEYIVAGVVVRDEDRFTEAADTTVSAIYMPFAAVYDYEQTVITSYEAVIPNPVEDFGREIVKKLSPTGEVVENTGRFSLSRISDLIFSFGERAISDSGIVLPAWENAARLCEDHLALLTAISALLLVFPLICLGIVLVKGWQALRATGKRMAKKIREG